MDDIIGKIKTKFTGKIGRVDEKSARRIYIDVGPQYVPEMAGFIFNDLHCRFVTASGMDVPAGIEILYHFSYDQKGIMISLRALIADKSHPEIGSIAPLFKGAEWIEREIWELLGVNFVGHPNLKHLLLIDDWPEGKFPLRHDHKHEHEDKHES